MAQSKTSWQCSAVAASGPPGNADGCILSHTRGYFPHYMGAGGGGGFPNPKRHHRISREVVRRGLTQTSPTGTGTKGTSCWGRDRTGTWRVWGSTEGGGLGVRFGSRIYWFPSLASLPNPHRRPRGRTGHWEVRKLPSPWTLAGQNQVPVYYVYRVKRG